MIVINKVILNASICPQLNFMVRSLENWNKGTTSFTWWAEILKLPFILIWNFFYVINYALSLSASCLAHEVWFSVFITEWAELSFGWVNHKTWTSLLSNLICDISILGSPIYISKLGHHSLLPFLHNSTLRTRSSLLKIRWFNQGY